MGLREDSAFHYVWSHAQTLWIDTRIADILMASSAGGMMKTWMELSARGFNHGV